MGTLQLIRPLVRSLKPYVPGEQPGKRGLVKLNTNENPYPPSPKVLRAIKRAADGRLRLYPPPTAAALRARLARLHCCTPDQVIVGNGSDELLAIAVRAFAEPRRDAVQWLEPCYSLYPVITDIHGARRVTVQLGEDFSLPPASSLHRDAALTFVTTPNAPSGRGYERDELGRLCRAHRGVVLLDEAYVDFAPGNAMALALERSNVIVTRTFSKGYSLCALRVGYAVGPPALISAMDRIRDSYNVNGLAQVAALATLEDLSFYRNNFRKVAATRKRLERELRALDFEVLLSRTNFLLVRPPRHPARSWLARFRKKNILVRWFDAPRVRDYLRISVGTDREVNALLRAARSILA